MESADRVVTDECCSVWSRNQDGSQGTAATVAPLSKSRGLGKAGESVPKDEADVGEDGYDPESGSVGIALRELRRYQGLRRPELPPASGGAVVSGLLPLRRLILSDFVFKGTRDSALGDVAVLDEEGGSCGIERGVGV